MNSIVAYSPQYLTPDANDESAATPFDEWSQAAKSGQSATANTFATGTWITEPNTPLAYETLFRFADPVTNLVLQSQDALVSDFAPQTNDSVSSAVSGFVLRREAPPVRTPRGNTSAVIAEWEGYVMEIHEKTIEARLKGLTGEGVAGQVEEATIPKSEITDADKPLVAVGALFRLCISYEKTPAGERRKYSTVVFRRLPAYRQQDLDEAHERTRARLNGLRVD